MTGYSFSGKQVDVKATNLHGSAPIDTTLSADYNGLGVHTQLLVGTVVIPGGVAGSIDVAGAGATNALGVLIETRLEGDSRLGTYTYFGWVRVMTDGSAIVAGSPLKCAATGKVAVATAANGVDSGQIIGKALEANGSVDGTIIQALVWFGGM